MTDSFMFLEIVGSLGFGDKVVVVFVCFCCCCFFHRCTVACELLVPSSATVSRHGVSAALETGLPLRHGVSAALETEPPLQHGETRVHSSADGLCGA